MFSHFRIKKACYAVTRNCWYFVIMYSFATYRFLHHSHSFSKWYIDRLNQFILEINEKLNPLSTTQKMVLWLVWLKGGFCDFLPLSGKAFLSTFGFGIADKWPYSTWMFPYVKKWMTLLRHSTFSVAKAKWAIIYSSLH